MNFRVPAFLFALFALSCALIPRVEGDDSAPVLSIFKSSGFCLNGVWGEMRWPNGRRPDGLQIWGSFCGKGNDNVGRAESQEFLAPSALNLYLAGYPGLPDRRLMLRNVQSGEERELTPGSQPGETWRFDSLPVPSEWIGKRVQFIAEDQATGPSGWLGFSLPILTAEAFLSPPIDTDGPQSGFCPDGAYGTTKWPAGGRPKGIRTWGSYCKSGDGDTGWGASPPVNAGSEIYVYIAGYPDTPGLSLAAENMQTGRQIPLQVPKAPGELWERYRFALPSGWKGQFVRVVARDQSIELAGWLAFSEPVPSTAADKVRIALKTFGLVLIFTALLLVVPLAVCATVQLRVAWGENRGENHALYLAITALLTLGSILLIDFCNRFWNPGYGVITGAGILAACVIAAYFALGNDRGLGLLRNVPREGATEPILTPRQRRLVVILTWGLTGLAILPVVFHWAAPPPYTGSDRYIPIGVGYLAALGICYGIYRTELRRLSRPQAVLLVFLVLLLTSIVNNVHSYNVDQVTRYFSEPNRVSNSEWQSKLQDDVIRLVPLPPHSYRFLPNAIVRWMQLARMDFDSARDLYRLLTGLLLFYAIYKYARLYCNYTGAIIALLFAAMIYPVSFEYYAGQLTDPLSHLSFVLAFIFLETEEFVLLLSTLLIGSLAKETVLAMAGYYVLFCRKERNYPVKAATLCVTSLAAYFGVRFYVLHGAMHYEQASGVTLDHVWENWQNLDWQMPFLLTACALLPFLALGWKDTPLSLKRQTVFLFTVLFVSSLFFSWLREGRNYMPLVFVLAVVAGRYLGRAGERAARPESNQCLVAEQLR